MQDVWNSAMAAKDPAGLAAIYAEDGALLPPNSDTISGRAAIEAYWAEFQASGIGAEITDTEVYAHSDIGYSVGTFVATDAGGATLDEGKYVVIWRFVLNHGSTKITGLNEKLSAASWIGGKV